LRLLGLGRLVAEAVDEGLEVPAADVLALALLLQKLALLAPHPLEGVVVAAVELELPGLEMDDPVGDAVQEVAVVADQDQRPGIALEVALEPKRRLEVEVVGRLVEQHQVRLGEQRGGQGDAHPPAAGKAGERPALHRLVEAQALEDA
jgi:hypothetical protein